MNMKMSCVADMQGNVFSLMLINGDGVHRTLNITDDIFEFDYRGSVGNLELTEEQEMFVDEFDIDYLSTPEIDMDPLGMIEWGFKRLLYWENDETPLHVEVGADTREFYEFHAGCFHGPLKGAWVYVFTDRYGVKWDGAGFDFLPEKDGGE